MSTAALLPRLVTAGAVAEWLLTTTRAVLRMARAGEIPCVTLPDGSLVFDAEDLAGWLEQRKGAAAAEEARRLRQAVAPGQSGSAAGTC
jgi:hypothetical protein